MAEAIRLHTEVTGERPLGWYTGRCSVNTVDLVTEEGGFAYVSDTYDDDLPYWREHAGRQQLIIPYTLDANDMRFAIQAGLHPGRGFLRLPQGRLRHALRRGRGGQPKMMSIGLHCRLIGRPGRAAALARFLDYARGHDAGLVPDPAARSPGTGPARHPAPRAGRAARRSSGATTSSRASAGCSSTRPGSPSAPGSWSSAPPTTPPRPAQRAGARLPLGLARTERLGRADRAPRPRRQARRGEAADAGIDRRAGRRRARRADRRRARPLHRAERGLRGASSAFRSSSRCAGSTRPTSSRPSSSASATTATPSSPPPAGRSSGSRCCGCATCCPT